MVGSQQLSILHCIYCGLPTIDRGLKNHNTNPSRFNMASGLGSRPRKRL